MCEWGRGAKAGSTLRCSGAGPHPSTNRALCRLTSEVERDPVHSTRYGRQRQCASEGRCPGGRGIGGGGMRRHASAGSVSRSLFPFPPSSGGGDKCLKSLGQALPARESQKGPEEAGESQRESQREPERERERERESQTEPARVRELPLSPPLPPNGSYKSPRESPSSASGQASAKDAAARGVNSDAVLTSS